MNALPAVGIIHGSLACDFGNKKHKGYYNFRSDGDMDYMMVLDAINRHVACLVDGEDKAKDSLVHHLGHVIADAAIALDCLERGTLNDNRPPKGCASRVLDREASRYLQEVPEQPKYNFDELLIPNFRRNAYPINDGKSTGGSGAGISDKEKARLWDQLQTEKDRSY